jgi:chromosome partitioning protein
MKNVFAFCNQKGGVGKTTSAVNMATIVASKGYKTLLIDMDSQGNATSGLGIEKQDLKSTSYQLLVDNSDPEGIVIQTGIKNLRLIPANADLSGADLELINRERREFILAQRLASLKERFEFIFIDCPPSLGLITVNCLTASDYIMIPLQCEYYALEGLGQLISTFQLVQANLNPALDIGGVILTMADFRTNLTQQVIEEVRNYFKDKVFEAVVPRAVKLSEAPSFGKPAVLYDPHNRASKSYQQMTREFLRRFKPESSAEPEPVQEASDEPIAAQEQNPAPVQNPQGGNHDQEGAR